MHEVVVHESTGQRKTSQKQPSTDYSLAFTKACTKIGLPGLGYKHWPWDRRKGNLIEHWHGSYQMRGNGSVLARDGQGTMDLE